MSPGPRTLSGIERDVALGGGACNEPFPRGSRLSIVGQVGATEGASPDDAARDVFGSYGQWTGVRRYLPVAFLVLAAFCLAVAGTRSNPRYLLYGLLFLGLSARHGSCGRRRSSSTMKGYTSGQTQIRV